MARYRRWNIILSFQLYFPVRRKYFFSSEKKIFVCVVEKNRSVTDGLVGDTFVTRS